MPRFNFTFQESSPLIAYTGIWMEGSNGNDTLGENYDGSFMVTNSSGATAQLNFNGTGISLFGGLRPNHGDYSVNLDFGTVTNANGNGNAFRQALFQSYDMPYEQHNVEVTNQPSSTGFYFDLDFVQVERRIGLENDTIFQVALDDTSPFITYHGSWEPSSNVGPLNNNGTIHQATQNNSQLVITFQGSCVELYGLYANAAYMVALDGGPAIQMQGQNIDLNRDMWHPQTLLYLVDGLSENVNHTVSLTTTMTNEQRPFSFDSSVIRSTQKFSSSTSPFFESQPSQDSSKHAPVGAIVGASIGGVVLLVLMVVAYIVWRKRRTRRASIQADATKEVNNNQTQRWFPWFWKRSPPESSTVSVWYPPSDHAATQEPIRSPEQPVTGTTSSTTIAEGSLPNIYPSKRRQNFENSSSPPNTGRPNTPGQSSQPGTGGSIHGETNPSSNTASAAGAPQSSSPLFRPPDGGGSRSTMVYSTSTSHPRQINETLENPVQEEDAGFVYGEDREETLPPAYNPGWDQRR